MMEGVAGVCVVGLGQIGGSLLRAAADAGHQVWGAAQSTADAAAAVADGFHVLPSVEDAVGRASDEDALVVMAVPLPSIPDVLHKINELATTVRLSDVVSVKAPVADMVHRYAPRTRYVGGHPMTGTEGSGWRSGSAETFRKTAWVLTVDKGTDVVVWADFARLAIECGSHVVPTSATEHDLAVARISHLPHILAAVLASAGVEGGALALALAAGSFIDGTRVAAGAPELVRAMCEGNRDALLEAMDDALGRLGAARGSLASTGGLRATIDSGHWARRELEQLRTALTETYPIDLRSTEALDSLRELGQVGGRITEISEMTATASSY
jgi:prephenate dehydrogenase